MMLDHLSFKRTTTGTVLALSLFLVGCQQSSRSVPVLNVTTQRLVGSQLSDIGNKKLIWTFSESNVVIENDGTPIPSDLILELLGNESAPTRIDASWKLDEKREALLLTISSVDGEATDRESVISVKPAGHVRVNLGSRQYNVDRSKILNAP